MLALTVSCSKKEKTTPADSGFIQLQSTHAGDVILKFNDITRNVPVDRNFIVTFSTSVDTNGIANHIMITKDGITVKAHIAFLDNNTSVVLDPLSALEYGTSYSLAVTPELTGSKGERFPGFTYDFITRQGSLDLVSIQVNGVNLMATARNVGIDPAPVNIAFVFSQPLNPDTYAPFFTITGTSDFSTRLSADSTEVTLTTNASLQGLRKYYVTVSSNLTSSNGFVFTGYTNAFFTAIDSVYNFPVVSDEALLTKIQQQTFGYFWDYAHPACGLARERMGSGDVVTIGGSGFGVMALIVGVKRGFITRAQALQRMDKILTFLETCDRFHGAWPHWLNGSTGQTIPFSPNDDGGDLVETSFMIQGLLTFRQYLEPSVLVEKALIDRINALWQTVEYDFYSRGEHALYWHWSPTTGWEINLKLQGYNETMICYVLGIGSPQHSIPASSYYEGYMNSGSILNGSDYYGYVLPMGPAYGGPLFFTQYSFLGLDPRNLRGPYVNYWEQNVNHSLINWAYCAANPQHYAGYTKDCWGLTASDGYQGYSAHSPTNDRGVLTPTAAISSLPYTPEQSMNAIHTFYYFLGDKLWGTYGFYDAFSPTNNWYANSYLAIDQGPIISMIENERSGLLWNLFMSCPEIQKALDDMNFTY